MQVEQYQITNRPLQHHQHAIYGECTITSPVELNGECSQQMYTTTIN